MSLLLADKEGPLYLVHDHKHSYFVAFACSTLVVIVLWGVFIIPGILELASVPPFVNQATVQRAHQKFTSLALESIPAEIQQVWNKASLDAKSPPPETTNQPAAVTAVTTTTAAVTTVATTTAAVTAVAVAANVLEWPEMPVEKKPPPRQANP
eukprot:6377251-Prymnesium_polylepis.1